MNIGIDISQIVYEGTGVGRFVNGLVEAILTYDTENRWTFFFSSLRQQMNAGLKKEIMQSRHALHEFKMPPSALSFLWNTIHRMKVEKLTGKLDWFITSDWTEAPSLMKKATIVHDLAYIRYPHTVHPSILRTQQQRMKWVKKESRIIFTDSQATKNDVIDLLGVDKERIFVNYPGVEISSPALPDIEKTKKKYNLKKNFILSVGKIEPRKNIKRLIEAFKLLELDDTELIIVGHQGWDTQTSKKQSETNNVKFLSYITDMELAGLYHACMFFVYPSLYEGFGYPLIEAMRCGAAVATSNVSSMKELSGKSSLLFNPHDTGDIAQTLKRLKENPTLRANLKKQGIIRSRQYTWKRYYDTMIDALCSH